MIIPHKFAALALASALAFAGFSGPTHAAVIDLTHVDFEFDGSPWTLGWKFAVHEPVFAHSLGVYDSGQDGLADSAQVGLWLATGGEPLVTAIIPAGTDAALDGFFRFVSVSPVVLTPGIEYVLGSSSPGELATSFFGGNGVVDHRVTVIEARYSSEWTGFAFPELTDSTSAGGALLGANLQITPVPLPAGLWLFGGGLTGLTAWARRKHLMEKTPSH
ncbi:MAG: VPLPA-CTERM sorting domain-containing protein [Nitrospira sp.]|nr:VPLPA-CTERM sorting domain-containing protein [Nitrospira sp.]